MLHLQPTRGGNAVQFLNASLNRIKGVRADQALVLLLILEIRYQFQYTLNLHGEKAANLSVTYCGGDAGRTFGVLVNERPLKTERLTGEVPSKFFDRIYPFPAHVIDAAPDDVLTIKFLAK